MIVLRNDTGRKRGNYIRYEYGKDLFGHMYLDIIRSKKHRAQTLEKHVFQEPHEFVLTLDVDLDRRESLHYYPIMTSMPNEQEA